MEEEAPSTTYVASVQGQPTKPRVAARPATSRRMSPRLSPTNVSCCRSMACSALSCSLLRMGESSSGPLSSSISKGMPNAGSGVRMSLQAGVTEGSGEGVGRGERTKSRPMYPPSPS